jgi:hypothetical protein
MLDVGASMSRPITLFAIFIAALAAGCAAGPVMGWAAAAVAGLVAGALALAAPFATERRLADVEPPPPARVAVVPVVTPVVVAPAACSPPAPEVVVAPPPAPRRRVARTRPPRASSPVAERATLAGPGVLGAPAAPTPDAILGSPELMRCMVTRAGTMRCPEGVRVQRKAGIAVAR